MTLNLNNFCVKLITHSHIIYLSIIIDRHCIAECAITFALVLINSRRFCQMINECHSGFLMVDPRLRRRIPFYYAVQTTSCWMDVQIKICFVFSS